MSTILSPGRWRGMQTTSTPGQVFAIVAFDQRGNYRRMLPADASHETAVQVKYDVVRALSPYASAILLDPIYGLKAALQGIDRAGLLMCIEKTGYSGDATYRRTDFIPGWTINKLKLLGASAAKLLIYYHPDSGELVAELDTLIERLAAECHSLDLPLFVEPLSYSLDPAIAKSSPEFARQRPQIVCETARRLSRLGADVLKLEFPVDVEYDGEPQHWREACVAVSEVCAVPWVLLSAGVDFETFEHQVQIACQAGASGFLGGRAIWKESIPMPHAQRQEFLQTVAVERLKKLSKIATESARPWTDFYTVPSPAEDWFRTYFSTKENSLHGKD